jgi:hypothetical protein
VPDLRLPLSVRTFQWIQQVRKYAKPPPNSTLETALQLYAWRVCFLIGVRKNVCDKQLSAMASEFEERWRQALWRCHPEDSRFLRRIANASRFLQSGKIRFKTIQTRALLVYERMERELGRTPSTREVLKHPAMEGISRKSEERVRKTLASLARRKP